MVIGIPKKVLKIIIFRFIFFLKIIDKKKKIKYNSQAVEEEYSKTTVNIVEIVFNITKELKNIKIFQKKLDKKKKIKYNSRAVKV